MSTATTTSHDTGQHTTSRTTTQPTTNPATQTSPNAAQRLRTTMAAVKLSFTWLGVRKTLAPEQRTTAARAFHADRELLTASKLILDTKNPAYRAVAAVRSFDTDSIRPQGDHLRRQASGLVVLVPRQSGLSAGRATVFSVGASGTRSVRHGDSHLDRWRVDPHVPALFQGATSGQNSVCSARNEI